MALSFFPWTHGQAKICQVIAVTLHLHFRTEHTSYFLELA